MNRTTKAEREALLEEAKRLLQKGGYDPKVEFEADRPGTYTTDHARPILDWLIAEKGLSKERARAITARALRQLRFKAMNGWRKEQ